MKKEEVIKWLKIMKANLNTFPEVSSGNKIEALAEAIRLLKNEQSIDKIDCNHTNCINCVNHKYCDYETTSSGKPNKSENPTGSTIKNGISNKTIIYKAKESKEIQKDLDKLSELNKTTTKNDLGVDCIDRTEVLKAMDTWDKFGNDPNEGLIPLRTPALQDRYVPYVKYEDMVNCVKNMPSVTPIRPKGHWIMTHDYFTGAYESIDYVRCSCCHEDSLEEGNYCPNCGAEMSEVEE